MGVESKEAKKLQEEDGPLEALFGSLSRKKQLVYPENTEFRIYTGNLDNESDKALLEQLLTKSFRCQNVLKKAGDLAVLEVTGTFDKKGQYHAMAKYAYLPEDAKK